MPSIADWKEPRRRVLYVFYVLDTSECMTGEPIAILNGAVTETLEALRQQAKNNADALVKIAVLEFSSGCRWMQPKDPEPLESFIWQDLKAGGLADMGAALKELDSKLSQREFLSSIINGYRPLIFFVTGSYATDDYKKALDQIRQNKWFARGTKIGFAIGAEADAAMIAQITGSYESVVQTDDLELFARLLKFASVTATMLCSQSQTSKDAVTGGDILDKAKADILEPGDVVTPVTPNTQDMIDDPDEEDDIFNFDDADFD